MKLDRLDRRISAFGVGRAALFALLFVPSALAADTQPPCTSQLGDDRLWSQTGFDDSSSSQVVIESAWRELGRQGYDGILWFRCTLTVADEARIAARKDSSVVSGGRFLSTYTRI